MPSDYYYTVKKYTNIIRTTDSAKTGGLYNVSVTSFSGSSPTLAPVGVGSIDTSITHPFACSSYISPSGKYTWTNSGTYIDTIANRLGCDSIMTINLTVNQPSSGDTNVTACNNFTWYGTNYTASGTPTYTEKNKVGCDSVVTLHLTIKPSPVITISGKDTILIGNNDTLKASGATTYSWTGGNTKDTIIVSPTTPTSYTVTGTSNGCSSTTTFTVDVEVTTGITALTKGGDINLYPNPANTYVTITMNNGQWTANSELSIFTESGQQIETQQLSNVNSTLSIDVTNLAAGVYFVRINTATQSQVIRFVKSK